MSEQHKGAVQLKLRGNFSIEQMRILDEPKQVEVVPAAFSGLIDKGLRALRDSGGATITFDAVPEAESLVLRSHGDAPLNLVRHPLAPATLVVARDGLARLEWKERVRGFLIWSDWFCATPEEARAA